MPEVAGRDPAARALQNRGLLLHHRGLDGAVLDTNPEAHTVHCLRDIAVCRAGGFAILEKPAGATTWSIKYRLDATGNSGADFTYTGTWSLDPNGGMTITVDNTNGDEEWSAAIDRSYNSFAFVDDFEEVQTNNTPELNFGFGVRRNDN